MLHDLSSGLQDAAGHRTQAKDALRCRKRSNLLTDGHDELLLEGVRVLDTVVEGHIRIDALPAHPTVKENNTKRCSHRSAICCNDLLQSTTALFMSAQLPGP